MENPAQFRMEINMVETWGAAENDLRQNQPERLSAMLARLFGLIGLAALR